MPFKTILTSQHQLQKPCCQYSIHQYILYLSSNLFCIRRVSIPLAIFSYVGIEMITVTAFEASQPSRLKGPAKHIAYIITAVYLISIGGFIANVEWFNQNLPTFFNQSLVSLDDPQVVAQHPRTWVDYSRHTTTVAPVIALLQVGSSVLPDIINGVLIYSGLSAANTALYVASRTLYGLTRDLSSTDSNIIVRLFSNLNTVSPTTRIPVWSLIVSCLAFSSWLPFIAIKQYATSDVSQILPYNGPKCSLSRPKKLS